MEFCLNIAVIVPNTQHDHPGLLPVSLHGTELCHTDIPLTHVFKMGSFHLSQVVKGSSSSTWKDSIEHREMKPVCIDIEKCSVEINLELDHF